MEISAQLMYCIWHYEISISFFKHTDPNKYFSFLSPKCNSHTYIAIFTLQGVVYSIVTHSEFFNSDSIAINKDLDREGRDNNKGT